MKLSFFSCSKILLAPGKMKAKETEASISTWNLTAKSRHGGHVIVTRISTNPAFLGKKILEMINQPSGKRIVFRSKCNLSKPKDLYIHIPPTQPYIHLSNFFWPQGFSSPHLLLISKRADIMSITIVPPSAEKHRSKAREVFRKRPLTRFHSSKFWWRNVKPFEKYMGKFYDHSTGKNV